METIYPEYLGAYNLDRDEDTMTAGAEENLLAKIVKFPRVKNHAIQANQNRQPSDYYACTIYSACGAICDLMGYDYDTYIKLIEETRTEAKKKGQYSEKSGAFTANSVLTAKEVHNRMFPKNPVAHFRTEIGKSLFYSLLIRGYSMVVTFIAGKEYKEDVKDGVLDKTSFKNSQGGHCNRLAVLEELKPTAPIKHLTTLDNYFTINGKPETGYRRWKIPKNNMPYIKIPDGGVYYQNAYFFLREKDL